MSLDIRGAHGLTVPKVPAPTTQTFTASGTWTKPAGAVRVFVEVIGAGGGAGAGGSSAEGGGGGEGLVRLYAASSLSASISVTVGAGGTGQSGLENAFQAGHGGDSSFGALLVARGGTGAYEVNTGGTQPLPGFGGGWNSEWAKASLATRSLPPKGDDAVGLYGSVPAGLTGSYGGHGAFSGSSNWPALSSRYGGGGGGAWNSGSTNYAGGASIHAGAGGTPVNSAVAGANDGVAPGGGGAGYRGTASYGGNGARGEVRVTTYYA